MKIYYRYVWPCGACVYVDISFRYMRKLQYDSLPINVHVIMSFYFVDELVAGPQIIA